MLLFLETSPVLKHSWFRSSPSGCLKKMNIYFSFDLHITQKRSSDPEVFYRKATPQSLAWQDQSLVRKFQVAGLQIYLESTPSPLFSERFSEWLQTTYMTNKIRRQQTNAWGTNKLLDNLSLIIVNFEHGIACWVEYTIPLV